MGRFVISPCPQLLNFNPNARNLMESNTQLREMFQNPEFLRQLTSPETLQVLFMIQDINYFHLLPSLNVLPLLSAITLISAELIRTAWSTTT